MKSKKKLWIVLVIILVILIALAGTAAAAIMTGKVAITNKQKFTRGLLDVAERMSIPEVKEKLDEYKNMQQTPFKMETTVTGSINEMNIGNSIEMRELMDQINDIVKNAKITATVQADIKNKVIKENLKLNSLDTIEELSADLEYTKDRISLRSKELNEKYLTFTKSDVESSHEYKDLVEIFDIIDNSFENNSYLTEDEKAHFEEYYKGILAKHITDDMIKENGASILVDGKTTKCSNITLTLTGQQISEIIKEYIDKFQEDEKGKEIIIKKINMYDKEFDVFQLSEMIEDMNNELRYFDRDINLKISIYATMFKTYGFEAELYNNFNNEKLSITLGNKAEQLFVVVDDEKVLNIARENNVTTVNLKIDDIDIVAKITKADKLKTIEVEAKDRYSHDEYLFTINCEEVIKTDIQNSSKNSINIVIVTEEGKIDVTFNVDSNLEYISSVEPTALVATNCVNPIREEYEAQMYLDQVQHNAFNMLIDSSRDSRLFQILSSIFSKGNILNGVNTEEDLTSVEFNNMFRDYTGVKDGEAMKELLNVLATNNNKATKHKVIVSIVENDITVLKDVTNFQELITASLFNIDPTYQYIVFVTSVDSEGYIEAIEIKKQ